MPTTHVKTHRLLQVCKQAVIQVCSQSIEKFCAHFLLSVVVRGCSQIVTSLMALSDLLQGCSDKSDTLVI
jgi:hypothetical protein